MSKPKVLYVDDEVHNLNIFTASFRRYYHVFVSASAREAINILRQNDIDLIITDQRMPDMTGVQFLEAIIPEYPHPTRMILTGFSDVDAIIKAINNGSVLRYLTKPWNEQELKQNIDMGIRLHDLEEHNRLLLSDLKNALKKQKETIEIFQKYVPEHTVAQVLSACELPLRQTEGEYRIISVLFCDIRNFTSLSEVLAPKELVDYLNQYLDLMINCINQHHGTVYKLLGDGLLVLFGAPVSSLHNQKNAVLCALDMIKAAQEFNLISEKEFKRSTTIGVGISTGGATVGDVVSEHLVTYAAIGDVIDHAVYIESLTKEMPNTILVDQTTYQMLNDEIKAEPLQFPENKDVHQKLYKVLGNA